MSLRWLSKLRWQRMSRLVSLTGSHTMSGQHTQPAPQSIYCTDQTMACQNIACTLQHKESPTLECIHTCCSWFLNSLPNQRLPPLTDLGLPVLSSRRLVVLQRHQSLSSLQRSSMGHETPSCHSFGNSQTLISLSVLAVRERYYHTRLDLSFSIIHL